MAEGGESGYEADLESNSDWEDEETQYGISVNTNTGHRQHFIYPIFNLTFGDPFTHDADFETECEDCPTSWRWKIELFREDNGSVSYKITNKRTDRRDQVINAAAWVRLQDSSMNNGFFHRQKYTKDGMMPRDELTGSCSGAVTSEEMQNLQDNELVLHLDMIVKSCHRKRKRKHESDSSNS